MATLNSRITILEQQTPHEIFTAHHLATCTDEELEDIFFACAVSSGSHENFLFSITDSEANHGNT